jgi:NhaP-type Na+/H+ or K+/H+ antiporter
MSNTAARVVYKPVGLLTGMVAGAIASMVFRHLWKRVLDEEDAPDPLQREYPWREIVLAAAIQGAIFAVVRAIVNRGGAEAFRKVTGIWPGD